MRAAAIITARGGSKRIPRKNIREFCGKPILAYSIEAALESGIFDVVMVSTDDREIAELAESYGAQVPFWRSEENANDFAATKDVVKEVLEQYAERGEFFDIACCIYPTAPLLTAEQLRKAVELLEENQADSVVPVVKFGFPPQRSVVKEGEFIQFKWPEYMQSRSQDLQPYYHDAGQFYCLRTESFLRENRLFMTRTVPLELSEMEVQDIDNEDDWKIAELKYELKSRSNRKKG